MSKKNKIAVLWTIISLALLAGIYVAGTSVESKDLVVYVVAAFSLSAAAFMIYLAIDGMKNGIIYFGPGGPFSKSHDPSGFWGGIASVVFLAGAFLIGAIKLFMMLA